MPLFRRRRTNRRDSPAPPVAAAASPGRNGAASAEAGAVEGEARPGRQRKPDVGLLRRERRALLAVRDSRMRDLGGLTVEMYRYGAWRSDLLQERCAELAGIESRLADIDALLGNGPPARRCVCGAVLREGAQFCSNCGRIVADGDAAATVARPAVRGR